MSQINILEHFREPLWSKESESKRYIILQGGAGSGKAVPLDTKVITPDGYKLMGDIRVGDFVCNALGGVSVVLNKWENKPRRIYRIILDDGRDVRCADNHMWTILKKGKPYDCDTMELINIYNSEDVYLPLTEPVFFENPSEDVLPVVMGMNLAIMDKGNKLEPEDITCITKSDMDKYKITKNGKITRTLPKEYMRMSPNNRFNLISAIYSVCGKYDDEAQLHTMRIKDGSFAKKIRTIIWSLGGICYLRYSSMYNGYLLKFDFDNCILKEALIQCNEKDAKANYVRRARYRGIRISSIVAEGKEECQCIEVDSPDHLYLIDDYVVTHNSAAICQRLAYLFLTRDDTTFAVVRSTMPALTRSVYLGDPSIIKTLGDWGVPVGQWLNKTEATLRNPLNGNVMYFIGLDDPEKIKSMNLNYIFIEEATEINADKWSQLNTRLRRHNPHGKNQMYIAYNPISYYNWVVQMFVVNPDPLIKEDSVVHFSNFTQNPYVGLEDVRGWFARASQDESYYRTYIIGIPGQPLGLIYPGITFTPRSTWPDEVWEQKPYYGIDWGFIDPMVLVECRDYDGKVYVICKYYETKKNTKDFLAFMDSCKISKNSNIYYDSADAERGSLLLQAGYTGFKARKDINAGISYVKGFNIIVDSMGPYGEFAMDEIKSYTWQTDPDDSSKFIEKPIEENNHFCLAGDSLITTDKGDVPIKDIKIGDMILTRKGYRKVIDWAMTSPSSTVDKLTTVNGRSLICTPNHKIYSEGEFICEEDLEYGDILNVASDDRILYDYVLKTDKGIAEIPVYNITVEDEHEYFANGILVSNCDALRYAIVTDHMYNRNYGVGSLDFSSVEEKLRKGGVYMGD